MSNDTVLTVNKITGEGGEKITIDEVLFASDGKDLSLGSPNIKDAKVKFEIIKQDITFLKVLDIEVPGLTFPKAKAPKVEKLANEEEVDKAPTKKKVVKKKTATKAKE